MNEKWQEEQYLNPEWAAVPGGVFGGLPGQGGPPLTGFPPTAWLLAFFLS